MRTLLLLFFPGISLWLGVGGIGLPLLATVLLLNLSVEERGPRRMQVIRAVGLFLLAYVATALAAVLVRAADALNGRGHNAAAITAAALSRVLFDDASLALSLAAVAVAASVIGAVLIARRRP